MADRCMEVEASLTSLTCRRTLLERVASQLRGSTTGEVCPTVEDVSRLGEAGKLNRTLGLRPLGVVRGG